MLASSKSINMGTTFIIAVPVFLLLSLDPQLCAWWLTSARSIKKPPRRQG